MVLIDLDWENRLCGVIESGVESFIFVIEENGFIDLIFVCCKGCGDDSCYVLIVGGYCLMVVMWLGWDKILVLIFVDIFDCWVKFMELGDNLVGKRLDCLEEIEFLIEW